MSFNLANPCPQGSIPIECIEKQAFERWAAQQSAEIRKWAAAHGFVGKAHTHLTIPQSLIEPNNKAEAGNGIGLVVRGVDDAKDLWSYAALPKLLPSRLCYHLRTPDHPRQAALGWALGQYGFDRYKTSDDPAQKSETATLIWPEEVDRDSILNLAEADKLARDLINTPANDMGPTALAEAAFKLAEMFDAKAHQIVGEDLLRHNYPAIHAVGRASSDAPRLIELLWGDPKAPKVTLVGKGVCFDSGGLNIKPANGMLNMKKDMGGAAHALGLARLVMAQELPIRLRVLIPAVENSISGNAFRPRDILATRKGLTIEVGHTDAEGRVILADALCEADQGGEEGPPDLILDFATLTGAARVALGPDIPPFYSNDDQVASDLAEASARADDPLWLLPLWEGYERELETEVGDISSSSNSGFAGSITAALFLQKFISKQRRWAHFDIFAWNPWSRPGRPTGAVTQGLRACFTFLNERYDGHE